MYKTIYFFYTIVVLILSSHTLELITRANTLNTKKKKGYLSNVTEYEVTYVSYFLKSFFQPRCYRDITIYMYVYMVVRQRRADFDREINQGIMKLAVVTFHLHHAKFDALRSRARSRASVNRYRVLFAAHE